MPGTRGARVRAWARARARERAPDSANGENGSARRSPRSSSRRMASCTCVRARVCGWACSCARAEGPVALAEEPEARAWAFHSCHPHRSLTIGPTGGAHVCTCVRICASVCVLRMPVLVGYIRVRAVTVSYNRSPGPRSLRRDRSARWHSSSLRLFRGSSRSWIPQGENFERTLLSQSLVFRTIAIRDDLNGEM